jgi:hypothetical protein
MELLELIKKLQAELMAGDKLPHLVSIRLLARLDEAERHLPAAQAPQPPMGETAVVVKEELLNVAEDEAS